jgi:hypothetical protein
MKSGIWQCRRRRNGAEIMAKAAAMSAAKWQYGISSMNGV